MLKFDCICLRDFKDFYIGIRWGFGGTMKFFDIHAGLISIYFSTDKEKIK
jgi:hypothetical protein